MISYIKKFLGSPSDAEIEAIQKENNELKTKIEQKETKLKLMEHEVYISIDNSSQRSTKRIKLYQTIYTKHIHITTILINTWEELHQGVL